MSYAAIPAIIAMVGAAASVYGTIQSGKAESKAAREQAAQAERVSKQKAQDEEKRHQAILATQEARYAASGLTMEGSPILVKMESMKESEEQLRRIREGGEYESMTSMERAKSAKRSGAVAAVGETAKGVKDVGTSLDWW